MAKFLIENDYYLIPDQWSWIIGKEVSRADGKTEIKFISYHTSPEKALNSYICLRQKEACMEAEEGTIKEMVDILSAEYKRLSERLKCVFQQVCDIDFSVGETE